MREEYVVYKSFSATAAATNLAMLLQKNRIPFQIEDTSSPMDPVIVGTTSDPDFRIKIRPFDFAKADQLLEAYYGAQAEAMPEDYYLFEFTDAELYDIIEKPDEWGTLDYKLAQQLLKERGLEISPEHLHSLKIDRLKKIAQPETLDLRWIIVGYLSALVFGIVGIFFGYIVATSKKSLPDGSKEYIYTDHTRKHGWSIFTLSCICTLVFIYSRFLVQSR